MLLRGVRFQHPAQENNLRPAEKPKLWLDDFVGPGRAFVLGLVNRASALVSSGEAGLGTQREGQHTSLLSTLSG